ncbi:hypothetical protein SAY86_028745 [Trapa natans]|uniref:Homeobox domain-containing protein n=1 Tax=Trapa natans TaxID=22666 RepID=A0AAN7M142_TRANT|nr:hypothetical protein SAY86_028745 [Trapa natans]
MASSNRHWPSMFKSKPHQWQHDINPSILSTGCHRSQYSSGCEERTPEPKPRWNPKPEQIRILEAIFDSGMVNPPRDEIRKIRAQLQEYGQVGDANVFYWFQNRKSRSKHKLRHLQNSNKQQNRQLMAATAASSTSAVSSITPASVAPSSSSSSSDNKSSSKGSGNGGLDKSCASTMFTLGPSNTSELLNRDSSNFSLGQPIPYFPSQEAIHSEQFPPFPASQGFLLSEPQVSFHGQPVIGPCGTLLLSETMDQGGASNKKVKMNPNPTTSSGHGIALFTASETITAPLVPSSNHVHVAAPPGIGGGGTLRKVAVFINDVAFEVAAEPFNVQAAFGNDVVLINSAGQPVVTDEWGLTLQPLQHGAFYYLI